MAVYTYIDARTGKRTHIRALPTGLLIWLLKALAKKQRAHRWIVDAGNPPDIDVAIAEEVLRRIENGQIAHGDYLRALAARIASPRCKCGGPGLYIAGLETFCSQCRGRAVGVRVRLTRRLDSDKARAEEIANDHDRELRSSEKHHRAMGRNKGRHV